MAARSPMAPPNKADPGLYTADFDLERIDRTMSARNVVVAQSGGPTCVINNSLRGIVDTCRRHPGTFRTIYAGHFGIEGVLKEELLDLSATPEEEVALLRTSPAAGGIGTCRYKLKKGQDLDFERVVEVLRSHDIGYFFYIGGNDSQDTAHKLSKLAHDRGLDLVATGVPKTIDAVDIARQDGNGWMATILRDHGRSGYSAHFDKVPLEQVANSERLFPERWICSSRIDVTDEFLDYAQPLIGEDWVSVPTVKGLPRFARITRKFAPRKLPEYVPQTYRKT